jgi:3-deoxy-D-manno-octulosonate 8-phosphate phosphatase (KDO 8-P phosphatase)
MQVALQFSPELLLKAQGIRVAFLDVDGVMTDGGLYFSASGETVKRFHVLDGYGVRLLHRSGIVPVVITGRDAKALRVRLQALGVVDAYFGVDDKHAAAQASLRKLGLQWDQAAVMGDDWPDLPLVRRCGFSAAPPNAHEEVLAAVDYVTHRPGGQGAVRCFCDLLLTAAGKYAQLLEDARA